MNSRIKFKSRKSFSRCLFIGTTWVECKLV